ncbi:transcription-repair coupling factor [Bacillus sp. SM2101]|uniref:transcription-repair coupling factor n=1 Tax=Bacillus sp. SM2101 TaxID=2805366 RepID=UPI001BDF3D02|nr:transcription-repair coupling factor [Bacillus sp. SM2101]
MLGIQEYFLYNDDLASIVNGIDEGLKEQLVAGLSGSARSLFFASIYKDTNRPLLIVTHNLFQAQKIYDDLLGLLSSDHVFLYPVNETIASEIGTASPELKGQRLEVLDYWCSSKKGIVIAPVAAIKRLLPPKEVWDSYQLNFSVGNDIDIDQCLNKIVLMGYSRASMVTAPGEFSVRGGIIDIYPLTEEFPIRIELFDTEIESIRTFAIDDQRSLQKIEKVTIGPSTEILISNDKIDHVINSIEDKLGESLKKTKDSDVKKLLVENITAEIEQLKNDQLPSQVFKYLSLFYEKPASLLDYVPNNGLILFDEMSRIQDITTTLDKEEAEWYTSLLSEGKIIHDLQLSHHFSTLIQKIDKPLIYFSLFLRHVQQTSPQNIVNITCKQMQSFFGQMHVLKTELERWKKGNYTVVVLAPNEERQKKIQHVLEDYDLNFATTDSNDKIIAGTNQIVIGDLNTGFDLPLQKLVVITEEELFKNRTKKTKPRQKLSNAERIKSYSELKVGDYVVHINHGIGKYIGIETLEINGIHKDYLHIEYQGSDKLYVPVEQINQVQKYVGSEGKDPKVYKLGGTEWKRVKKKVESSVQDIADDLIKLYAEREASKGYSYSPDGDMQREFESAFPYEETVDQLRSIGEIKKDMEKERPMDRLLCGDVGYGKTEVAIRAAFKAIVDEKQVAILVPTTILAQQHYETIQERFQDYPINIGLLSRFRSRKQQLETIKGLKDGTIDLVVGTHRVLSKDISFRDLGMLIIDEEQRFGVTHKEKIKQMKANIDVLTLTATPIPRTLHMSMLGVRDLSVIETPPENRFPVQTYVVEYNGALIREAIERELSRGGQIYFLYNRVEDIERKAEEISMLVPDARVAYAHGKMTENELESVILNFLEGEIDVLVSTTIIETGVDIPNVNTLIVFDADKMGLSQLYQLRGRVGRSNRVAYSYFTHRKDKVLSEVAEKRLQAIKEFTELGSGFKIAMRDLSIRGAGNLLGSQQHGFIDTVGFDLYSQMLKEAIDARRGNEPTATDPDIEIDVEVDAYIPDQYVSDGRQKIDMYKRFRAITTLDDLEDLQEDMTDRFGEYPDEVSYLFQIAEIKVYAIQQKILSIKQVKHEVTILFSEEQSGNVEVQRLVQLTQQYGRLIGLGMEGKQLKVVFHTKGIPAQQWLASMYDFLKKLADVKEEQLKTV